jgi:hypothetical protein
MTDLLTPYGFADAASISKVGKSKTPISLADRMPTAEIAAKVGSNGVISASSSRRVVRRNSMG